MKKSLKICLLILFLLLTINCRNKVDWRKTNPEVAKIKVGDKVVTGSSSNIGYVEKIDEDEMTIRFEGLNSPYVTHKSIIYKIPETYEKPNFEIGDLVIANIEDTGRCCKSWNSAKITEKHNNDTYTLLGFGSRIPIILSANQIIKLTHIKPEESNSSEFFDFNYEDNDDYPPKYFENLARTKKVPKPKEYKPKIGEKVLAKWTVTSWWSGKVKQFKGDKFIIAWDDGSAPSEADSVIPYPNDSNVKVPTIGQFVLAKHPTETQWNYAQTISVVNNGIEIRELDGETRTIVIGEAIPLE